MSLSVMLQPSSPQVEAKVFPCGSLERVSALLKNEGPFAVYGNFGPGAYNEAPYESCVISKKRVFCWRPQAKKMEQQSCVILRGIQSFNGEWVLIYSRASNIPHKEGDGAEIYTPHADDTRLFQMSWNEFREGLSNS